MHIYIVCICVGVHYGSSNPQLFLAGFIHSLGVLTPRFSNGVLMNVVAVPCCAQESEVQAPIEEQTSEANKNGVSHDLGGSRVFLGGGFKYLFSTLFGEDSQFD